jgi:quercetin dioxygenase-like cupin family protein
MTSTSFVHVADLAKQIEVPANGTLSITVHQDEHVKVVLFGFSQGQELSEHTASVPAILQQVRGRARWRLGGEEVVAEPGAWAHMPANLPHAIVAESPSVMLLTMIRAAGARPPGAR